MKKPRNYVRHLGFAVLFFCFTLSSVVYHASLRYVNVSIAKSLHCSHFTNECTAKTVTFNPGLIAFDYRRQVYTNVVDKLDPTLNHLFIAFKSTSSWWGACEIVGAVLNSRTLNPMKETTRVVFTSSMREDPRLFVIDGILHISYTLWGTADAKDGVACFECGNIAFRHVENHLVWQRMALGTLAQDGSLVAKDLMPDVGNNLNRSVFSSWEKNWGFFERGDELFLLYSIHPFVIYSVDKRYFKGERVVELHWELPNGVYTIRGGSTPVLVGGTWYTFVHSASPWPPAGAKRRPRYSIYVLSFADSTFGLLKLTPTPLVMKNKPHIFFPSGALYVKEEETWLVSIGVDDSFIALMKVSMEYIEHQLRPLETRQSSS